MKHIVFTIDHKFVRFCAVTMVSILKNDTPSDITVHVVANGLSEADRTVLSDLAITYGASIAFYEVPQEKLEGYAIRWEGQRLPMVVFYRCLLASLLPAAQEPSRLPDAASPKKDQPVFFIKFLLSMI